MDPLLRAAVEQRDREQYIARDEADVAADEQRMRMLNEVVKRRCENCGRRLRTQNTAVAYCSTTAVCPRLAKKQLRALRFASAGRT